MLSLPANMAALLQRQLGSQIGAAQGNTMQPSPVSQMGPAYPGGQPAPFALGLPGQFQGKPSQGSAPFGPMSPFMGHPMFSSPQGAQYLQSLFSNFSMPGTNSGGQGMAGPAPNPFTSLARFSGPFGNGGGPIAPGFGGGFGMPRARF